MDAMFTLLRANNLGDMKYTMDDLTDRELHSRYRFGRNTIHKKKYDNKSLFSKEINEIKYKVCCKYYSLYIPYCTLKRTILIHKIISIIK